MLAELGVDSLEALTKDTVHGAILREPFLQTGSRKLNAKLWLVLKTSRKEPNLYLVHWYGLLRHRSAERYFA